MNTLPFNILSAIFAPIFVPWIEWTLDKSERDSELTPNRIRADRIKPNDFNNFVPKKPRQDVLCNPQIIDEILNPFFRGIPGACIGNIIWGLSFNLDHFSSGWFCFYIILLFACVGFVNIVKTKKTKNPRFVYILLICLSSFFVVLTAVRLISSCH